MNRLKDCGWIELLKIKKYKIQMYADETIIRIDCFDIIGLWWKVLTIQLNKI